MRRKVAIVPRSVKVNDHDEEETICVETITEAAVPREIPAPGAAESRADARPVRLDHPHGARQLRPRRNEGLVRQGSGLDIQAELPDAGWR